MEKLYKLKPEIANSIKDKMPRLASIEQPLIWWANLTAAPVEDLVEVGQSESYINATEIVKGIADWKDNIYFINISCTKHLQRNKSIEQLVEEITDKYEIKLKD